MNKYWALFRLKRYPLWVAQLKNYTLCSVVAVVVVVLLRTSRDSTWCSSSSSTTSRLVSAVTSSSSRLPWWLVSPACSLAGLFGWDWCGHVSSYEGGRSHGPGLRWKNWHFKVVYPYETHPCHGTQHTIKNAMYALVQMDEIPIAKCGSIVWVFQPSLSSLEFISIASEQTDRLISIMATMTFITVRNKIHSQTAKATIISLNVSSACRGAEKYASEASNGSIADNSDFSTRANSARTSSRHSLVKFVILSSSLRIRARTM